MNLTKRIAMPALAALVLAACERHKPAKRAMRSFWDWAVGVTFFVVFSAFITVVGMVAIWFAGVVLIWLGVYAIPAAIAFLCGLL